MPRFANLIIRRIIAHQIFERDENREIVTPRYNTGLTTLDDEGLNELQDRIINAIGNNSHSVELDITNVETNSTFSLVTEMLHSENNVFIERSKQIALKLAEAQTVTAVSLCPEIDGFKCRLTDGNRDHAGAA